MNTIENVIVTVGLENGDIRFDLEIPVEMQGKQILDQVADMIKLLYPEVGFAPDNCKLMIDSMGKTLEAEYSLEEIGIWEGSILTIACK